MQLEIWQVSFHNPIFFNFLKLPFLRTLFHQVNIKILILSFPKNHVEFLIDISLNLC